MGFKPYMMKNINLVLGDELMGEEFKCQARGVTLTPSVSVQRTKTACPNGQFADIDDPEWNAEIKYLFGMDDGAGSVATILADYLLAHVGEDMPITFRPIAGGPGYTGKVKIVPGAIGGDYGSFSEQSVSLPLLGQPEKVEEL